MGNSASVMTYSVTDFLATGNGGTDDSAAINAAIAFVTAAGGGTVFFPPPSVNYLIASSINLTNNGFGSSNISLVGVPGWDSVIKCSTALNGSNALTQNDLIYGVCNAYALTDISVQFGGSGSPAYDVNDTLTMTSQAERF